MEQLNQGSRATSQLDRLAGQMRSISPERRAPAANAISELHAIEQHSLRVTLNRRWATATAIAAVSALAVGFLLPSLLNQNQTPMVAATPATVVVSERIVTLRNTAPQATMFDLGLTVGRLLAQPKTQFSYDPAARMVFVQQGTVIAHIFPGNRGFRVSSPSAEVEVQGTLFAVTAESGAVRVWHGEVKKRARDGSMRSETFTGTEAYDDISPADLDWLGFEIPDEPNNASTITASISSEEAKKSSQPKLDAMDPERLLVLRAQAELSANRWVEARRLLTEHRTAYPDSALGEEVSLLVLQAAAAQKDLPGVIDEGEMFLLEYQATSHFREVSDLVREAREALAEQGR